MTITIEKKVTTVEQALIEVNIPSYWKNDKTYYKVTNEVIADFTEEVIHNCIVVMRTNYFPNISKCTTGSIPWDHVIQISKEEFETAYEEVLYKLKY
jgi:hypothetical protein